MNKKISIQNKVDNNKININNQLIEDKLIEDKTCNKINDIVVENTNEDDSNNEEDNIFNNPACNSIMNDIADDIICQLQYICTIPKYNKKINDFLSYCIKIIFNNISPYLYIIISILILMFLMNCFQFYYYVKLFIENSKNITNIPI